MKILKSGGLRLYDNKRGQIEKAPQGGSNGKDGARGRIWAKMRLKSSSSRHNLYYATQNRPLQRLISCHNIYYLLFPVFTQSFVLAVHNGTYFLIYSSYYFSLIIMYITNYFISSFSLILILTITYTIYYYYNNNTYTNNITYNYDDGSGRWGRSLVPLAQVVAGGASPCLLSGNFPLFYSLYYFSFSLL